MDAILRSVTRRPLLVLLAVLALTLLAVSRIVDPATGEPRLAIDPSADALLPEDDEERAYYEWVRRLFGSDETLLVALLDEDVFSAENLGRIRRLTDRISSLDGVHHVLSLANAPNMRSVDGDLEIAPFYDEVPSDPAEIARIRREAQQNPVYSSVLVPRGDTAALLLVYLADRPDGELIESGLTGRIARIAEEEQGDASVWVTGNLFLKAETARIMLSDLSRSVPLATLVVAAIALLAFRAVRGVLIPLGTVAIALIWTLGFVAAVSGSLNLVTAVVPPLVIVVGFAYAVHVVAEYYDVLRSGGPERDGPVLAALRQVWLPVLLTGVTTAAGFLSLLTSPMQAVQQFGVFAAAGVIATMLASLSFAPAALQLLPRPRALRAREERDALDRALLAVGGFVARHRQPTLWAGALLALISCLGIARIQVNTDYVRDFPADNPVRQGFEMLNRELSGAGSIYVVLESPTQGAFLEPENLREIQELQRWLEDRDDISATTSLADYVAVLNRGFHDGDPEHAAIPDSKRMISQLLYFGASDQLESFVDSRHQRTSILVRGRAQDSQATAASVRAIEARLADLPEHIDARVTGGSVLLTRTLDAIALGQALSLGTAFAIILLILCLLFTSLRIGLIALIPNALPVLAYFGLLGFSGVPLGPTTGLVACLVLGIAVDDTIHFLARFNAAAHRLADEEKGAIEALRSVGRPVTTTSAALCLGFLVMTTSELRSQVHFGALASATLALAWLIDVTFTPALALRMRVVTLWDALTLDLGDDPQRQIPLFEGMSRTQARIVALLASIQTFPRGQQVLRAEEEGDEMFVVIDGELAASVAAAGGRVRFGTLRRGAVFGEVALFHGRRTADVDALSEVRLLRLTQDDLERIRRRYPRTAAQLYRNLSRVLAHHVARTTERVRDASDAG